MEKCDQHTSFPYRITGVEKQQMQKFFDAFKSIAEAEAIEERQNQERVEKRLQQRIDIAEFGSRQFVWQNSPDHNHDDDFFNERIVDGKKNSYGKLKYKNECEKGGVDKSEMKSHKKNKKAKKSKKKKSKKSRSTSEHSNESTDIEIVEVNIDTMKCDNLLEKETIQMNKTKYEVKDYFGPEPPKPKPQKVRPEDFGRCLMPGEGKAMSRFVAQGKRIPRRGEIALTSEDIFKFEADGYVMSGSRNRAMEAIRTRKENQIFSEHDKRMLALFNNEAKEKKESQLLNQFRELIHSKKKNNQ